MLGSGQSLYRQRSRITFSEEVLSRLTVWRGIPVEKRLKHGTIFSLIILIILVDNFNGVVSAILNNVLSTNSKFEQISFEATAENKRNFVSIPWIFSNKCTHYICFTNLTHNGNTGAVQFKRVLFACDKNSMAKCKTDCWSRYWRTLFYQRQESREWLGVGNRRIPENP